MSRTVGIDRSDGAARSGISVCWLGPPHAHSARPAPDATQNCRRVSSAIGVGAAQHALERAGHERDVQVDARQPARHAGDVGVVIEKKPSADQVASNAEPATAITSE